MEQTLAGRNPLAMEYGNWSWEHWKTEIWDVVSSPGFWFHYGMIVWKLALILIVGRFIRRMSTRALNHILIDREKTPAHFNPRRAKTLGKLLSNVISYTVNFIVIMMVLNQFGFNLAPLLAGAGVIGLAIGFGAQSLVKDVITGFFIIFEDQFAVGDVVQIGAYKGTVEEIGIRVTRVRSWTGETHIIPNGSIAQVTNFSVHNSMAVLDISVAYDADIDAAIELIRKTLHEGYKTNDNMVGDPKILGVQSMNATEVVIRVIAECKPNSNPAVTRLMNAWIKKAFDEKSIKFRTQV
ncbi:mechanosensitive ion channel family protein [Paenibacillus koleovorans]|uniref:mechanosensitive ion channel family protein n=1 Tax=Paenibacillus koleovorans TaxID=121608 RepID=UPI001FE2A9CF|nr:mechanosensitive ion channel family protein [Paenibacillus koleovorans]